jgi:hypothetical protein
LFVQAACKEIPTSHIISLDTIREGLTYGIHPCNARRKVSSIKAEFASVDFSEVSEEDDMWERGDGQETNEQLLLRVTAFLAWLERRPETNVLVVTHCVFLFGLLNEVLECDEDCNKDWFTPGELRSFTLQFPLRDGEGHA